MIKLTFIRKDLLEEIIEKLGSFVIAECEVDDNKMENDSLFYDIKFDTDSVFVVFHKTSLTVIKDDRSIVIDSMRFYQCLILWGIKLWTLELMVLIEQAWKQLLMN